MADLRAFFGSLFGKERKAAGEALPATDALARASQPLVAQADQAQGAGSSERSRQVVSASQVISDRYGRRKGVGSRFC
jgi:hypothetical protein